MKKCKITNKKCALVLLTGFLFFALAFVIGRSGQNVYADTKGKISRWIPDADAEGMINGIGWYYKDDYMIFEDGDAGTHEIPDFNNLSDRPWDAYKNDVEDIVVRVGGSTEITAIGKNAFKDFSNLRSVKIYQWITEIRSGAFANCPKLEEVTISNTAKNHIAKDAFDPGVKINYVCTHPRSEEKYKTYNIKPATLTSDGSCDVDWYCGRCGEFLETLTNRVIPKVKVYLKKSNYSYTGKVITPVVVVRDYFGHDYIKGEDYTVSYASGRKNVGSYTVTVKGRERFKYTKKLTFKINPKGTTISKLSAAKQAFTVKVKKQASQTTGYEVAYSTDKKFKKSATKKQAITSYKTTSKKITGLKKGKKYYVKVRTYKTLKGKKYYSSWSVVKTVKAK